MSISSVSASFLALEDGRTWNPTIIALDADAAYSVYQQVLNHCAKTQSRFGIFDIVNSKSTTNQTVNEFREKIGVNNLNYGAAYYPWLKTNIVATTDVNFENIDDSVNLEELLPEPSAKEIVNVIAVIFK
jgi:hypothetical protein